MMCISVIKSRNPSSFSFRFLGFDMQYELPSLHMKPWIFFLGRGPRAFLIGKISAVNPEFRKL